MRDEINSGCVIYLLLGCDLNMTVVHRLRVYETSCRAIDIGKRRFSGSIVLSYDSDSLDVRAILS